MAYSDENTDNQKIVDDTLHLWRLYSTKREMWATHAQEDKEFYLGKQWTDEQVRKLESRGQAPITVNRIFPAVEAAKAMLTSNNPQFRVSPREDSDNKVAQVMNGLLEYIWQISDGQVSLRRVIEDYYCMGLGAMLVYQDPIADYGKGEVKMRDVDPLDIYIDPNSRDLFCDDAENIIISRRFTKEQAEKLYPMYESAIQAASGEQGTDRPVTTGANDGSVHFPEDVDTMGETEYIRGYERYSKIMTDMSRVFQTWDGKERIFEKPELFQQYLQTPAAIFKGKVIVGERDIRGVQQSVEQQKASLQERLRSLRKQLDIGKQEAEAQYAEQMQRLEEAYKSGEIIPERYEVEMRKMGEQLQQITEQGSEKYLQGEQQAAKIDEPQMVNFEQLVQMKRIEVVMIQYPRIKQCIIVGETLLYSRILPIDKYPIIFFMNHHTRTPYPMSDVRVVKDMQKYINKVRSMIIAHATTSTNNKVLIPEGAIDMAEFEEKWAQPGVGIAVDFSEGPPVPVQPLPLPNELFANEQTAKSDIDHQLGLYELMMGNSAVAPQTYKATISLDEFGQRKIRSKQNQIEAGLKRACEIAIPLAQQTYQSEKIFRLIQPNNSMNEYVVNKQLVDDKTGEIQIMNDIRVGSYDVVPVTGSTLPTNRYAQLELYMEMYKGGIIDKVEVLKKTEVFDMEGVLKRTDIVAQLQQQLQQAGEAVKSLKGDIQTKDREIQHLSNKVETEKFKGKLSKVQTKAEAAGDVYGKRLDDALSTVGQQVRLAEKEDNLDRRDERLRDKEKSSPATDRGGSSKKKETK